MEIGNQEACKYWWSFNNITGGDVRCFMLPKHKHKMTIEKTRTYCQKCQHQYNLRIEYLDRVGYLSEVYALFQHLKGKTIRFQQFASGSYFTGKLKSFDVRNCTIDIETSRGIRFGWVGVLNDESRFWILDNDDWQEVRM